MQDAPDRAGPRFSDRAGPKVAATLGALAVAAAVAVGLIFDFVAQERQRALAAWQARLGIVAEARTRAVDRWLGLQFAEIAGIAENEAVRLYATRVVQEGTAATAEADYLRNLLVVTADRTGFSAAPVGPDVPANVPRAGVAGIAILDMEGRVIAATRHYPALNDEIRAALNGARSGEPALVDLHAGPDGSATLGFAAPIFVLQGDVAPEDQIGFVLGLKPVTAELYPLLVPGDSSEMPGETYLLRANEAMVEFISPLADGTSPLSKRLARSSPDLAAATALAKPGEFGVMRDYRGREVLAISRPLRRAPWVLVHKVDRDAALAASDARLSRLLIILLLGVAAAAAAILAAWRHGASRRASAAAASFQDMAERYGRQRNFLRLLTDSQPNAIFIVDENNTYRFANEVAAASVGIAKDDMIGKSLASVLGPAAAQRYERLDRDALADEKTISAVYRDGANGSARVIQSKHVPLAANGETPRRVLVVEEDVTAAITERERRERTLQQLVETLVSLVDRRDPSAAEHSARVARVARSIASEMGLGEAVAETVEIAGRLLNIGKIMVPAQVLTRAGALSDAERDLVRDSIQSSAELLDGIEFDGPVAETLRQCQERWDGRGTPEGLAGESILITARVVHVANTFVAMASPRAHRPGMDIDNALAELMAQAGAAHDRRVVAALVNIVDNRGGRSAWADLGVQPAAP